ncbi:hypothetical protein C1H46_016300 [Malus baccata]|uniref:Uncharacterized protein n=1 Tax=Malus baccata TaxID=106549 RepID=A0A540MH04_MALBA|nr:hypothetical protein C1H46_016300 [Malus baccata]
MLVCVCMGRDEIYTYPTTNELYALATLHTSIYSAESLFSVTGGNPCKLLTIHGYKLGPLTLVLRPHSGLRNEDYEASYEAFPYQ